MGYPDGKRDMSPNAKRAYKQGLFPLSKVNKELLNKHGFTYSIKFFKWLCGNGYVVPSEHHHTSASFQLTAFYSPKAIEYAARSLRLDSLYDLYKGIETKESLLEKECVKYVRVVLPCSVFGLKRGKDITLDCIRYKNYYIYSPESIIGTWSSSVCIHSQYDERPDGWSNINTDGILHKIISRKKVSWGNVIGEMRYR